MNRIYYSYASFIFSNIAVFSLISAPNFAIAHDIPALVQQYIEMDDTERTAVDLAKQGRAGAANQLQGVSKGSGLEAVIKKHSVGAWNTGTTITACFFNTVPQHTRQKFIDVAQDWLSNANLKIDFGQSPSFRICTAVITAQIRIDVGGGTSFSQVGTDATLINRNKHTLNISTDAASNPDSGYFYTTALHEWGHAFGFEHEHQSPLSNCNFDMTAIYAELKPLGWDKNTVDTNFGKIVGNEAKTVNVYPFDPNSIMIYSLPSNYFVGGKSPCLVGQPQDLSNEDKMAMRMTYPARPLTVDRKELSEFLKLGGVNSSFKASVLKSITDDQIGFELK